MAQSKDRPTGGTEFAQYDGDLELDAPPAASQGVSATPPKNPAATQPSDVLRRGGSPPRAARKSAASVPTRSARPGAAVLESSRWEGLVLPGLLLLLLGVGGVLGYWIHCSLKASEKRRAFSGLIQGLRQALPRGQDTIEDEDIRALVRQFARKADVEVVRLRATIEPLTAQTITKLPRAARIAIGMASQIPHHRLPYSVIGFEATLLARYGWATDRFRARRYTWLDQRGPDAPRGGPAGSIGHAFENQLKDRLRRALGGTKRDGHREEF